MLSGHFYRVIDEYFTSSGSLDVDHQPYDARLYRHSQGWCTNTSESNDNITDLPWLQVEFGTSINITSISIGGASYGNNAFTFVDEFDLKYCSNNICNTIESIVSIVTFNSL